MQSHFLFVFHCTIRDSKGISAVLFIHPGATQISFVDLTVLFFFYHNLFSLSKNIAYVHGVQHFVIYVHSVACILILSV